MIDLFGKKWPSFLAYQFGDNVQIVAAGQWLHRVGHIQGFTINDNGMVKFEVQLLDMSVYTFHPVELRKY